MSSSGFDEDETVNIDPVEVKCLETVVKSEEPINIEDVINEIQNKLCFELK